jgi:hypothetical protein
MVSSKASRVFRVPQTTLERYIKLEISSVNNVRTKLGRKPVLPHGLEDGTVELS